MIPGASPRRSSITGVAACRTLQPKARGSIAESEMLEKANSMGARQHPIEIAACDDPRAG